MKAKRHVTERSMHGSLARSCLASPAPTAVLFVLLCFVFDLVVAPVGKSLCGTRSTGVAEAATAAAAAAVSWALIRKSSSSADVPARKRADAADSGQWFDKSAGPCRPCHDNSASDADSDPESDGGSAESDTCTPCIPNGYRSGPEDFDASASESDDTDTMCTPAEALAGTKTLAGKLWTKAQFPEGVTGHANWDIGNLKAAQAWECPCPDRRNCIGNERLPREHLYEHRKAFRMKALAPGGDGLRDSSRIRQAEHFDAASRSFTRSFVVGGVADCCNASAGLADGLSFATFASARTDVTKGRSLRDGRAHTRVRVESFERAHLRAHIRSLKSGFEGPKGGSDPHCKWHTGYKPKPQRWKEYVKARTDAKLPVIGNEKLYTAIWKEEKSIIEQTATGHPKCVQCGRFQVRLTTCCLAGITVYSTGMYEVYSVQCAVCSLQSTVCSVQCAVCSVQCAVCSVH